MAVVHAFIKDKYRLKFPELESLVHNPVEYARVVARIGNEADLTTVDLDDLMPAGEGEGWGGWGGGLPGAATQPLCLLPAVAQPAALPATSVLHCLLTQLACCWRSFLPPWLTPVPSCPSLPPPATIMVVTVTATTTSGRPLTPESLAKAQEGCALMLSLDADKARIIRFVEGRMGSIAPNLSAAIGSEVAARLMGVAGGLLALSRIPACNIQVLGTKRKHLAGLSSSSANPHQGFIFTSAVVQNTPPPLRIKAARLAAAKTALLARVDAYGQDPSGAVSRGALVVVVGGGGVGAGGAAPAAAACSCCARQRQPDRVKRRWVFANARMHDSNAVLLSTCHPRRWATASWMR